MQRCAFFAGGAVRPEVEHTANGKTGVEVVRVGVVDKWSVAVVAVDVNAVESCCCRAILSATSGLGHALSRTASGQYSAMIL